MKSAFAIPAIVVMLLAGARVQAQTLYGPTGLFVHPTAFVLPARTSSIYVSSFTQFDKGKRIDWTPVAIAGAPSNRAELGAFYVHRQALGLNGNSGGGYVKYQIQPDAERTPALALSGSAITGDLRQAGIALVASHRFRRRRFPGIGVHAGAQLARRWDIAVPSNAAGLFAGVELPITAYLEVMGDIGTRLAFNRDAESGFGVVWSPARAPHLVLGYVNTGRSRGSRLFAGVGYSLGGAR